MLMGMFMKLDCMNNGRKRDTIEGEMEGGRGMTLPNKKLE